MIETNEEQLQTKPEVNRDAGEHICLEDKEGLEGSSLLNKFKTVDALCKAYENLEKEFTKKCQRISELVSENNVNEVKNTEEALPQYQKKDWLNKVSIFLDENENAKNYVNEIAKIISEDENLAKKEDALELAYSKILKQNFKTKEQLAQDDDFIQNFIYKNEKIKNKIIEDYLISVENNKTIPLISSDRGSLSISSPKFMPKDLKEAGRYAANILKK